MEARNLSLSSPIRSDFHSSPFNWTHIPHIFKVLRYPSTEDFSTCVGTGRNTKGLNDQESSYHLDSFTYYDETTSRDEGLSELFEQKSMLLEDFRSHELRKTSLQPSNKKNQQVEIDCSHKELYEFHSNLVNILSLVEDGLAESFAIRLGSCLMMINVKNLEIQLPTSDEITHNFCKTLKENTWQIHEQIAAVHDCERNLYENMQKTFEGTNWDLPILQESLQTPSSPCRNKRNSFEDKIEWQILELSTIKQEYEKLLRKVEKNAQSNQQYSNNLKVSEKQLVKYQEQLERSERILKKTISDFKAEKDYTKRKADDLKRSLSKFISKFNKEEITSPKFEEFSSIEKKQSLLPEEVDKINEEIADLKTTIARSSSEIETGKCYTRLNRLKTQLSCSRSIKTLKSSPTYLRSLPSLGDILEEVEDDTYEIEKALMSELEYMKSRLSQDFETLYERKQELYRIWTRSYETSNLVDVIRSHTNHIYALEDKLRVKQSYLDDERIKLQSRKLVFSKSRCDFKQQQRCFQDGLREILAESSAILETL